ncbi:uncharacterized protein LOC144704806 [Wolffia australiana]
MIGRCRCLLWRAGARQMSNSGRRGMCAASNGKIDNATGEVMTREEAYKKIHDLDFTTAAKILFTAAPDKKKFGFDFHLVQFFFACLPSLAVYLVAQYARYDIRRMEAEVELKKKAEEEERAKRALEEEREKKAEEEAFGSEIEEVKGRLNALEETVKEIAVETKKIAKKNRPAAKIDEDAAGVTKEEVPPPVDSALDSSK